MTTDKPQQQQQQQEVLYKCSACEQRIARHRFPKKMFRVRHATTAPPPPPREDEPDKDNKRVGHVPVNHVLPLLLPVVALLVCHRCKQKATAARCHQPPPKEFKHGRIGPSGIVRRPNNFGYCNYVDKLFALDCFQDISRLGVFQSAKDVSESMAALQAALRHGTLPERSTSTTSLLSNHSSGEDMASSPAAHSQPQPPPPRVLCLCIGDGCTPRTAVLASFLTKGWNCVSIDPALSDHWNKHNETVNDLDGYQGTLEEFVMDPNRPPCLPQMGCSNSSNSSNHNNNNGGGNTGSRVALLPSPPLPPSSSLILSPPPPPPPASSWEHLVLLCVHSHARFREKASLDKIRVQYGDIPTTIVSLPCCPKFRHVSDIGRPPDVKYDDDCVFSACRSVEIWNVAAGPTYPQQQQQQCLPILPPPSTATTTTTNQCVPIVPTLSTNQP